VKKKKSKSAPGRNEQGAGKAKRTLSTKVKRGQNWYWKVVVPLGTEARIPVKRGRGALEGETEPQVEN